ncbi:MAG: toll/interleukin-1 receptor domain-containing protein [Cyanobacteria bacterium P01_B01_bin.77]
MTTADRSYQQEKSEQLAELLGLLWQGGMLCIRASASSEFFFVRFASEAIEPVLGTVEKQEGQKSRKEDDVEQALADSTKVSSTGPERAAQPKVTNKQEQPNLTKQEYLNKAEQSKNDNDFTLRKELNSNGRDFNYEYRRDSRLLINYARLRYFLQQERGVTILILKNLYADLISKRDINAKKYNSRRNGLKISGDQLADSSTIETNSIIDEITRVDLIDKIIAFHIYEKKSVRSLINFLENSKNAIKIPSIKKYYRVYDYNYHTGIESNIRKELQPIPDIFISYNTKDRTDVSKIVNKLLKCGIDPWIDYRDLPGGPSWSEKFKEQFSVASLVALFIGKNGLGRWQNAEQRAFIHKCVKSYDTDSSFKLIPIFLESFEGDIDEFLCDLNPFLLDAIRIDFSKSCREKDPTPFNLLIKSITEIEPLIIYQ